MLWFFDFLAREGTDEKIDKYDFIKIKMPIEFLAINSNPYLWGLNILTWKVMILCNPMACTLPDFSVHGIF